MRRIVQMRHRMVIEKPTDTVDDMGGNQRGWASYGERWGNIRQPSGREAFRNQTLTSSSSCVIEMRQDKGITSDMRIRDGADDQFYFRILEIPPSNDNFYMQVYCERLRGGKASNA